MLGTRVRRQNLKMCLERGLIFVSLLCALCGSYVHPTVVLGMELTFIKWLSRSLLKETKMG